MGQSLRKAFQYLKEFESKIMLALARANRALVIAIAGQAPFASVAIPSALSPLDVTSALSGAEAWVAAQKTFWVLDKTSTLAIDGITTVAAAGGGNWIRDVEYIDATWSRSGTWFIDPTVATGDTNNSGTVVGSPLKTWAEYERRVGMTNGIPEINQSTIVKILTDMGTGDPVFPRYRLGPVGAFTLQGTPTVVPLTGTGGVMTAITNRVNATNTPNKITDTGLAAAGDWSTAVNLQVHNTNATRNTISWVNVNNGGAVAKQAFVTEGVRRSTAAAVFPFNTPVVNVAGDTYEILRPTNVFLAGWQQYGTVPAAFAAGPPTPAMGMALDLNFIGIAGTLAQTVIAGEGLMYFTQCSSSIETLVFRNYGSTTYRLDVINCAWNATAAGSTVQYEGNPFIGSGQCRAPIMSFAACTLVTDPGGGAADALVGSNILLDGQLRAGAGGYVTIGSAGHLTGPAQSLYLSNRGGNIRFTFQIWGDVTAAGTLTIFNMEANGLGEWSAAPSANWFVAGPGANAKFAFNDLTNVGQNYNAGLGLYDAAVVSSFANLEAGGGLFAPDIRASFIINP